MAKTVVSQSQPSVAATIGGAIKWPNGAWSIRGLTPGPQLSAPFYSQNEEREKKNS